MFCFVVMRSTEPGCFRSCSWCLWKALNEEGCMGFGSMIFGFALQKFLNFEWFLHWKLNYIVVENFKGIEMCLWCYWKDLDEQDLMEFIGKIWIQNVRDIDFKVIFAAAENSNKFQKNQVLEGKISWECRNTREGLPFNSSMISFHIWLFKKLTYIAKQCWHVEFPYFVMGSHLGQPHKPH